MRYFVLLNLQHIFLWLMPTLAFIFVFALALAFSYFKTDDSQKRFRQVIYTYPGNIEDRDAPFPWAMWLIIIGTVIWAVGYIVGIGLLEVKI